MTKKILISLFVIFCCFYTALSLNKESTLNSLPDNIFLQTETGQIPFHKKDRNLYCYGLNTCGKISDLKDNYFYFTYNHFYKTKFFKTGADVFSISSMMQKEIVPPLIPFQFSFNYKQADQIIPVKCDKTGLCQKEDTSLPFSFIAKIKKQTPSQEKDFILIQNKNHTYSLLESKKDNVYQSLTPPRTFQKPKRFLLLLSSYKRPVYLSNLITRLNTFNYDKKYFDISISLKGVSQDIAETLFLSNFEEDIKQGHLFFRTDKNTNQFTNLLNTYRDIDLSNYDYLLKIDDDDWYHKDYLKTLNVILNTLDEEAELLTMQKLFLLHSTQNLFLKETNMNYVGATHCFSTKFAKKLLQIEKTKNIPMYEDFFIFQEAQEKYLYLTFTPLFIYNKSTRSIMRPN